MDFLSSLNAIGVILYLISYSANPEFRKKVQLKEELRKQAHALEQEKESIIRKQKANEERKIKIKNNEDLLEICLDDPDQCLDDSELFTKLKTKNINPEFKEEFKISWNNSFNKTFYGCFCRKEVDLKIYEKCPIDNDSLDFACRERHICLKANNQNWFEKSYCDQKFLFATKNILLMQNKTREPYYNHEILIRTAVRFKSLLILKNRLEILD